MKTYCISIIFIMSLCFFLAPMNTFACEKKAVANCCSTAKKAETAKKSCCTEESHKTDNNSCGGKCGHSNCTSVSSSHLSVLTFFECEFKNNSFSISISKPVFYHSESFVSAGFVSVWLPPKIK